jgi:hypothetical protein
MSSEFYRSPHPLWVVWKIFRHIRSASQRHANCLRSTEARDCMRLRAGYRMRDGGLLAWRDSGSHSEMQDAGSTGSLPRTDSPSAIVAPVCHPWRSAIERSDRDLGRGSGFCGRVRSLLSRASSSRGPPAAEHLPFARLPTHLGHGNGTYRCCRHVPQARPRALAVEGAGSAPVCPARRPELRAPEGRLNRTAKRM